MMRYNHLAAYALVALSCAALAQVPPVSAAAKQIGKLAPRATPAVASAASPVVAASVATPAPKGPVGIGDVKLGTTRDAIIALPESAPVRLAGQLVEKTLGPKDVPLKPGESRYDGALIVPGRALPLKSRFSFLDDKLNAISVDFDPDSSLFESMGKQIADRYGPGAVDDGMKEENCIYRNGSSFKIKSGLLITKWDEHQVDGRTVRTSLIELVFAVCPVNLSLGMSTHKSKMMSISYADKPVAKPNLF